MGFFSLNYNNQIAENVKFGFVLSRDKRYYLGSTFIGAARFRIFEDTGRPVFLVFILHSELELLMEKLDNTRLVCETYAVNRNVTVSSFGQRGEVFINTAKERVVIRVG